MKKPQMVTNLDDYIEIDDNYIDLVKYNVMSIIAMSGHNPDVELANEYILLYNNLVQKANENKNEQQQRYPVIRDIKYMKTQLAYLVGRSRDNKDNNEDVYSKEIDSKLNEYLSKDMLNKLSYKKTFNNSEHSFCKKGIEALYIRILPKIDLIISERKLEDFKELARYIEAIVSYHKFYGGN